MKGMEIRTYTVKIEPAEEGGFIASVPSLPGCFTQGETFEEVCAMAKEAIEGFIEALAKRGQAIPVENIKPERMTIGIQVMAPHAA
jgi:antitoxin HicB